MFVTAELLLLLTPSPEFFALRKSQSRFPRVNRRRLLPGRPILRANNVLTSFSKVA
jgi:hypothetical protein